MYCTAMLINIYCAGIIQLYPCSFIAKYHYQSSCYLKKINVHFFSLKIICLPCTMYSFTSKGI